METFNQVLGLTFKTTSEKRHADAETAISLNFDILIRHDNADAVDGKIHVLPSCVEVDASKALFL